MTEPTIEVFRIPPPDEDAQVIYQIVTLRRKPVATPRGEFMQDIRNITEAEAYHLRDRLNELLGGDDG